VVGVDGTAGTTAARRTVPVVLTIQTATEQDWPRLYPIYAAVVAEGRSYALPEGQSPEQARPFWMEPPPGRTVIAVESDTVLGTAKMGPNRPGRGSHIATASFMVNPAHHGRGVGRALAEHVVAWARHSGFHGIQFNAVVETNTAAVRLWQKLGFEIIGTVPEAFDHPEHGLVGLHVMFLRL